MPNMFMGSVLVAKDGKVVFSKSYGMADLEWNVPNSPTTRFNIASMTKQFTAASILLLEDRGKLKTDDLVKKYLPDAPSSWDKITIYHLLTHTSGIPDDAAKYEPGTPDKLVFNDRPLSFQPGEQWAYTNLGYIVLGYLLERISGQTYEGFVQENIFRPLGDERLGNVLLCDCHSATCVWLLARQQWDRKCGSQLRYKDRLFGRLSLFVNRRFASMGRGAVRRQAIIACIPAQNDHTVQERLCLRLACQSR